MTYAASNTIPRLRICSSVRYHHQKVGDSPTFPSLLLWDEKELQHFEAVTYSPDYYLTDCEIELLKEYSLSNARQIVPGSVVLELGSG